jgi:hypothetical protein
MMLNHANNIRKQGLFFNFGQSPCSQIRIRIAILNTDPDQNPVQPNECRSMRIWIQIHNTTKNIPNKVQIRIQIHNSAKYNFFILDLRSRGQYGTRSRIWICNAESKRILVFLTQKL